MISSGLSFFTIFPFRGSLEELACNQYIFPFVGFFLGCILFFLSFFMLFLPPEIASILLICCWYIITGIQHLDALLDFGDGISAHTSREERLKVMKSPSIGAGGFIFGMLYILLLYLLLLSIFSKGKIELLILAEAGAKNSILFLTVFGKSIHEGTGKIFVEKARKRDFFLSLTFLSIIGIFLLGFSGTILIILSCVPALTILLLSNLMIGGVSGDVLGASNEFSKIAILLLVWML